MTCLRNLCSTRSTESLASYRRNGYTCLEIKAESRGQLGLALILILENLQNIDQLGQKYSIKMRKQNSVTLSLHSPHLSPLGREAIWTILEMLLDKEIPSIRASIA